MPDSSSSRNTEASEILGEIGFREKTDNFSSVHNKHRSDQSKAIFCPATASGRTPERRRGGMAAMPYLLYASGG